MNWRTTVFVLAFVASLAAGAAASGGAPPTTGPVFYVSPQGSDTNPGTESSPWATLQHAADTVHAGDTVVVNSGEYAGFHLTTSGTESARIAFLAEPGATVSKRNYKTPDGINLEGASFVTIEGFIVGGVERAGIRAVTDRGVRIVHNTCDSCGWWGILTGFSEGVLIEGNTASHSKKQHGIYVGNSADNPVIRGNVLFANAMCGIHVNGDAEQGGDGVISGALIEKNVVHGNGAGGGSGINCDGVQNSVVRNNLLYDNHGSGISLYRQSSKEPSTHNLVANNTIVMAADSRWALNIQDGSIGNRVINNILCNLHSWHGAILISADSLSGLVSDHNAGMSSFSTDGGDTTMKLARWRSATGQDQHSVVAMPAELFVDLAKEDFHLSAQSPAVDNGAATDANFLGLPADDIDNAVRPQGNAVDIGAYESSYSGAPGRRTSAIDMHDWMPSRKKSAALGGAGIVALIFGFAAFRSRRPAAEPARS